jgi:Neuraminidase (sialidase)
MREKEVLQHYEKYLLQAKSLLGNTTTYLKDLNGAGKHMLGVKFKGCYASNKIPRLNDLSPYCILNLDRSDQSGSHWIAICKYPNSNKTLIYDSFGRDYKKIIPNLDMSGNGTIVNSQKDPEQKVSQTNCGQRCLAFIMVFDSLGVTQAKKI